MAPTGWKNIELAKLFEFKNGLNASKEHYGKGVKFINVMEVIYNDHITADKILGSVQLQNDQLENYLVKKGDVLFNRTSETEEEIGLTAVYLDEAPVVFGGFVIRARPLNDWLVNDFKKYCFLSKDFRKQAIERGQGGIRTNIGQGDLEKITLLIPPPSEQLYISKILSVWDKSIKNTALLIAAKQQLKKGLMQKILNPKNNWQNRYLGDLAKIATGGKDNQNKVQNGKYPFFVRSQIIERINSYAYEGEAILIPGEGGVGEIIHYIDGKFDFHQRVYKISDFDSSLHGKYLYYFLQLNFKKAAAQDSVKATVDSLRLPIFLKMEIWHPDLEEQRRISGLLTCCDQEIQHLKEKLDFYRQQKKALMQQLLTGKKRVKV